MVSLFAAAVAFASPSLYCTHADNDLAGQSEGLRGCVPHGLLVLAAACVGGNRYLC